MVDNGAIALIAPLVSGCRIMVLSTIVSALLVGCRINSDVDYHVEQYSDRSVSKVLALAKRQALAQGVEIESSDLQACYSYQLDRWAVTFLDKSKEMKWGFPVWIEDESQELISDYEEFTDNTAASIMKLAYDEVLSREFDLTSYDKNICFYPDARIWSVLFSKYSDDRFSELRVSINDDDLYLMTEFCEGTLSDDSPPRCK
jgi:hypothetical protein